MQAERRRTPRVTARGNAIVHATSGPTRCDIVNLSLGGVLLRAIDARRPRLELSDPVHLDLHLDGDATAWTHVAGVVQRLENDGVVCVAFGDISPAFEDVVEDEVLAGLESERRPRAVVVDPNPERAQRLAEGLRDVGCRTAVVTSSLEAIWYIERSRAHVGIVLVSEPRSAGTLMNFLRDAHPTVLRAAIGDRLEGQLDDLERVFTDQPDLGLQLRRLVGQVSTPAGAASVRPSH